MQPREQVKVTGNWIQAAKEIHTVYFLQSDDQSR